MVGKIPLADCLSGVYTSNLFNDLDFYLGQILCLYEAKYLAQIFSQTFCFKEGQYLAQIKFQIAEQIGCVDAALGYWMAKRVFFSSTAFSSVF